MRSKQFLFADLRPEKPICAVASSLESPLELLSVRVLENEAALKECLPGANPRYTRAIFGVYPQSRFLRHAVLENPSKAREADFFESYLRSQYQLELAQNAVTVLNPTTGLNIDLEKVVPREILFAGAAQKEFQEIQDKIIESGIYPERLELGTVATIGGLTHYQRVQQIGSSTLFLEWGAKKSLFAICSAKRLELLRQVDFGTEALWAQLKADLGLKDDVSAQKILASQTFDFKEMGPVILKRLIKEMQASAGFFEVQTGQPLQHFLVSLLPKNLAWVEEVLSRFLGLDCLPIDYQGWANVLGIQSRSETLKLGEFTREHLGLFSLMANQAIDGEKKYS